ncbi:MAG: ATP-binding cassette domain-containing protein, partial [Flammeovirgaceae bacterium]
MKRIKDFNETLDQHSVKRTSITKVPPPFSELRFEDVCFKYRDEVSNETFDLGPINITIDQGKIIFITGGNGSGKSTFIKILTGIYTPDSGRIFLNGEPVALENYGEVRNLISAVFTDNHLFSENYLNHDLTDSNPLMREYVEMVRMNGIFRLNSNENADAALSKGQQKRVALILALLDDRPILVLDEWAAEQDPGFRKYFYEDIIRTLCARNKTLLLVTHDEAHFTGADRIIKFNYGLCQEESPAQT